MAQLILDGEYYSRVLGAAIFHAPEEYKDEALMAVVELLTSGAPVHPVILLDMVTQITLTGGYIPPYDEDDPPITEDDIKDFIQRLNEEEE